MIEDIKIEQQLIYESKLGKEKYIIMLIVSQKHIVALANDIIKEIRQPF